VGLILITPPSTYPVSLDEAKAHLNVDFDDDDTLIDIYRKAATEDAESFTGRSFYDQTFDFYLDAFPDNDVIELPRSPLIEVIGVYLNGDASPVSTDTYVVDTSNPKPRISLPDGGSWPTLNDVANAIRVRFRAGYVDEDQSPAVGVVPFAAKAAIMLTLGTLYANRESVVIGQTATMMPAGAEYLLRKIRADLSMA
jgi:uncharacterized phiE125 gp8 family phage protein